MTHQKKLRELATALCQTLFDAGYTAYIAGGWVRDLLLEQVTDEIDIATNASPTQVQQLFEKTIPVGIAFGVVIVVLEGINFEVSTFRKDHPYLDGRHPEGVDFSTPEKDALRRDFTINGMFFDPLTEAIHDFVGGRIDLERGVIRAIGDPQHRFEEDRLRMIRTVRFASRLDFVIEEKTEEAIHALAHTLFPSVSMERIWQELNKMAAYPRFDKALLMLHRFGLLPVIFPQLEGLAVEEIETRLSFCPYFPPECPTIVYLLELFPSMSLEKRLALCDYLKTSGEEKKRVTFLTEASARMREQDLELCDWAHLYAHPYCQLFLQIEGAKILPPEREAFVEEHRRREKKLGKAIERIQKNKPLVTSDHLKKRGIAPGKEMGRLLREAERMAINEGLTSAEAVLEKLGIR